MAHQIPCLVTRDLGVHLAQVDRDEAAYDETSDRLNRESPAMLAGRIADYLDKCPERGPEGWQDMDTDELLAAVEGDDLLWNDMVWEAAR